ncbi:MAG: 4Fe-4S dicluster domain-containing protein [Dehalococcoidia bacterium]|nr:4Fe-4S dicluster domain-containing protein [Dehalococcoidia bacterium]
MAEDPTDGGREREISRRDFVKRAGATTAAVALVGVGLPGVIRGAAFPHMAESGVIMPDPGLCIGCLSCEVACSDVHREIGLSEVPRIRIYFDESVQVKPAIVESYGDRGSFMQAPCVQCPDAPCLPVCPVDAVRVEPTTGARIINESTCIACGKCEDACIFPTIDEARATGEERFGQRSRITYDETRNVYAKCDLCYFRPEGPACIEQCPVNIRINEGIIQSDVLCLDLAPGDRATFERMREQQAVPAGGEAPA